VEAYLHQPYDWFLRQHSADLGKTILSEVTLVINGSIVPMMQILAQGAVAVAIIGLLVSVNPQIAAIMFIGLGTIYSVIYFSLRRYLTRIGTERVALNRLRYQVTHEIFSGIKDVKVAGLEDSSLQRFTDPAKRYARYQTASQLVAQLPRYALELVALGGMLSLVVYAMNVSGDLSAALPLMALYALAGFRLMPALQQIYAYLTKIRFSGPALGRLHADIRVVSGSEKYANPGDDVVAPMSLESGLALEKVSYRYPEAQGPALDSLSMSIPAHSIVGFVGTTGSGKTTAVDVMLGLLTAQTGRILVDGTPVTTENLRSWQRAVGYVPQQVFLTDDTVAANIAFGVSADEIDVGAVERAALIANLHDFVTNELPQGYQTLIGERGVRLSGGQRQRIGIARALYYDPEILFLDEATSALDNMTEQAVMDAVHNLGHKKTIVLIAHRLSTVRDCDTIFILENGRLVDQGTYQGLLEKSARFRAMVSTGH
jgi:ABC-type multidrug transport system fused ATPase/permease subunit